MNMNSYSCCSPDNKESRKINSLSSLFQLIGERNRLQILCILRRGPHCVCELIEHIRVSQSLISHHLKDLKNAGLIQDDKQGLRVYYSLTDKGKDLSNTIFSL